MRSEYASFFSVYPASNRVSESNSRVTSETMHIPSLGSYSRCGHNIREQHWNSQKVFVVEIAKVVIEGENAKHHFDNHSHYFKESMSQRESERWLVGSNTQKVPVMQIASMILTARRSGHKTQALQTTIPSLRTNYNDIDQLILGQNMNGS